MKRFLDIALVLLALPVALPLGLLTAALVACRLGRPVLFVQTRAGRNGRPFRICKFRSMTDARGPDGELLPDAERLPPFGRKLRQTSLDELPQLWNVLKGDMSLVGPRPLYVAYNERYDAFQRRRLEVRPGITGLAQVRGRNTLTWKDRFATDVEYVERQSLWLDLKIMAMTVAAILRRRGVEPADAPVMEEFRGDGPK